MYERPAKDVQSQLEADRSDEKDDAAVALELARRTTKRVADEQEEKLREIAAVSADGFQVRRTKWLWRDRIPCSALSLIGGRGDTSKSTLLCQFTGWLTTGDMKGEFFGTPRNILYVVNEDSIEETILPRMIAHGADLRRVFFIKVRAPWGMAALSLPGDADLLRDAIRKYEAVATFVDPLSANTSGRRNDQGEMRTTYQVVNSIAEQTCTSIVGLGHTRKEGARDILEAFMGSSEQANVARSVHGVVADDKEDEAKILSCEKLNVGNRFVLPSLRFTTHTEQILCTNGEMTTAPKIKWLEETEETASDMLAAKLDGGSTGVEECAQVIKTIVFENGGEYAAGDAHSEPRLKKYNEMMMSRARKKAGVKSKRVAGGWIWYLPV